MDACSDTMIEFDSGQVVYLCGSTALVASDASPGISCWRGPFRWEVGDFLVSDASVEGEIVPVGRVVSWLRLRA